jgi:hypothetical protein
VPCPGNGGAGAVAASCALISATSPTDMTHIVTNMITRFMANILHYERWSTEVPILVLFNTVFYLFSILF